MRGAAIAAAAMAVGAALPVQAEVRLIDPATSLLRSAPVVGWRFVPAGSRTRHDQQLIRRFDRSASIHVLEQGGIISPFIEDRPGEIWRGRIRAFGMADGTGFSGVAIRARSVGLRALQSERHVSGFLASELRYGLAFNGDDLLTMDLTTASQRLPAQAAIGRGKSIGVRSLYLGASLVHDRRLTLGGGWYRTITSGLTPVDQAVERAAGMPAAGRGLRLALDCRMGPAAEKAPARIGLELRDGNLDDKGPLFAGLSHQDHRALLSFSAPF